jgi:hypothetical protein
MKKNLKNLNEKDLKDIIGDSKFSSSGKSDKNKKPKNINPQQQGDFQNVDQIVRKLSNNIESNKNKLKAGILKPTKLVKENPSNKQILNKQINNDVEIPKNKRGPKISKAKLDLPLSHLISTNAKKQEQQSIGGFPTRVEGPSMADFAKNHIDSLIASNNAIKLPGSVMDSLNKHNEQRVQNKLRWDLAKDTARKKVFEKPGKNNLPLAMANNEAKNTLSAALGTDIPDEINAIALRDQIQDIVANIPDLDVDTFFDDTEIKFDGTKKDKTGYYKITTNIRKDNIPSIINKIASYVKQNTNGIIKPRVCDLRVIANTNKNQLKNSLLKITSATVVFKPRHKVMKVNKMTRIMLSIPGNYLETQRIIVYLQESRDKNILEISNNDFPSEEHFINFLGDRIVEYFFHGYAVTLKKLQFKNVRNPLMNVVSNVVKTREFKAKINADNDTNEVTSVEFYTNGIQNEWLYIVLSKTDNPGLYQLFGKSKVDDTINIPASKNVSIDFLNKNLLGILQGAFVKDWTKAGLYKPFENDDYAAFVYELGKLKHRKLQDAGIEVFDKLGVPIKVMSKNETATALNSENYDAEAVVFKKVDIGLNYAALSYLAFQIIGGDKRFGRNYITTEDYYTKYHVKDRRPYPERERTVLKREGRERPYNSRIYLFQLEYEFKGKKSIFRAKTWEEIKEYTGILTDNIQFPNTLY